MISKTVPQNEQGSISGTTMALGSAMSIIGPLAAGTLYDTLGYAAPFVSGAIIFTIAFLLLNITKDSSVLNKRTILTQI